MAVSITRPQPAVSSMAGNTADGGLRSYASMTYAGLKSMIFAGLTPDDPRVEAALTFIRKNYSLETNPGMGDAGLFYYYHTFAKSLTAAKSIRSMTPKESRMFGGKNWSKRLRPHSVKMVAGSMAKAIAGWKVTQI